MLFLLCFCFSGLMYASDSLSVSASDDEIVFIEVEKSPEFKGGIQGLYQYLGETIVYPDSAKKALIQGRVILQFIINIDGAVQEVVVVRSSGNTLLDDEAVRVVRLMPKWIPGEQSGKPVRVKYTLPVVFKLNEQ